MENSILETRDYSLFKTLLGNREINKSNLEAIRASMRKKYLRNPIKVNEHMEIIDGQHRFEAAKSLGYVIYYFIDKGCGINDVQRHNSISRKWTHDDFLNLYCAKGIKVYLEFKDFMKEFPQFGIHKHIMIALGERFIRGYRTKSFDEGAFKMMDAAKKRKCAESLLDVKDVIPSHYTKDAFIFAFMRLFYSENYKHERFLQKMALCAKKLDGCSDRKQYSDSILEVYNFRSKDILKFKN